MRFYYKVSNMFKKLKGEINMKKFLSALMAIVLAISTALAASAAFDSRTAENSTVKFLRYTLIVRKRMNGILIS